MLRRIVESNQPTSEAAIDAFEQRFGVKLPKSYRKLMLKHNGGRPEPDTFPVQGFSNNPVAGIQVFFGFNVNESSDMASVLALEMTEELFPTGFIPFACTDGYDFICFDLRKGSAPVVYWDRRPYWGNCIWKEEYLYPITQDFGAFLDSLHDFGETQV